MIHKVRGGRAIKANHSGAIPRHILFVDTETLPVATDPTGKIMSHNFRLGVAISVRMVGTDATCERTHKLYKPGDFWELLKSLTRCRQTLWVVAHNVLFDFVVLGMPELIEQSELVIDWPRSKRKKSADTSDHDKPFALAVIDSPPTIIALKCTATQGRVVFVDTLNWFPATLRELGESIGRHKTEMPQFEANDERWFTYCENDTRIIADAFTALIRFVKSNDLGMFRYTAAAQAFAAFRHRLMSHKVYPHSETSVKEMERRACFGGRSEVFRMGKRHGDFYKVDVSSLFPSVMQPNLYPYTLESYEHRRDYLESRPAAALGTICAEVELQTQESIYPVRGTDRTIYPVGYFRTVLAGPELQHAADCGDLRAIKSWATYRMAPIFDVYVKYFWAQRMECKASGNLMFATFCKSLLNSLYGKFAQRNPEWEIVAGRMAPMPWWQWIERDAVNALVTQYRSFGFTVQRKCERCEIAGTFPAISAFVTAYARLRMNALRAIAGAHNCFYQGVDMLITNREGWRALIAAGEIHDNALGKLRLIGHADTVDIRGIGDYTLGKETVLAGRSGRYHETETGVYIQHKFHVRDRLFSGKALAGIEEQQTTWRRAASYGKGRVQADGTVLPFELTMSCPATSVDGSLAAASNSASACTIA